MAGKLLCDIVATENTVAPTAVKHDITVQDRNNVQLQAALYAIEARAAQHGIVGAPTVHRVEGSGAPAGVQ
jgi:hypothetical protein